MTKMLTVVSVAIALAACSGGGNKLSTTDIQLAAGDLRSFAASEQMLVEQCAQRHATQTFCREQSDLLGSKVEDALKQLNGDGGPVEPERKQIENIGLELRDIVSRSEQLSSAPDDAADAQRLSLHAKTVEDQLRK